VFGENGSFGAAIAVFKFEIRAVICVIRFVGIGIWLDCTIPTFAARPRILDIWFAVVASASAP
jgi:hypothetical protein